MKAITLVVQPPDGFHPANTLLADAPTVTGFELTRVQLLDDDTVVLLYRLRGDLTQVEQVLLDHPDVISCEVSGGDHGFAYIHAHPLDSTKRLLELPKKYGFTVNTPVKHVDGGVRVTFVGKDSVLQEAISNIPSDIEVTIERIEDYQRASLQVATLLTDRQQEIIRSALDAGYFESPRQVSQQELADQLDISPGTLSEHLQKIQQRIFHQLFR